MLNHSALQDMGRHEVVALGGVSITTAMITLFDTITAYKPYTRLPPMESSVFRNPGQLLAPERANGAIMGRLRLAMLTNPLNTETQQLVGDQVQRVRDPMLTEWLAAADAIRLGMTLDYPPTPLSTHNSWLEHTAALRNNAPRLGLEFAAPATGWFVAESPSDEACKAVANLLFTLAFDGLIGHTYFKEVDVGPAEDKRTKPSWEILARLAYAYQVLYLQLPLLHARAMARVVLVPAFRAELERNWGIQKGAAASEMMGADLEVSLGMLEKLLTYTMHPIFAQLERLLAPAVTPTPWSSRSLLVPLPDGLMPKKASEKNGSWGDITELATTAIGVARRIESLRMDAANGARWDAATAALGFTGAGAPVQHRPWGDPGAVVHATATTASAAIPDIITWMTKHTYPVDIAAESRDWIQNLAIAVLAPPSTAEVLRSAIRLPWGGTGPKAHPSYVVLKVQPHRPEMDPHYVQRRLSPVAIRPESEWQGEQAVHLPLTLNAISSALGERITEQDVIADPVGWRHLFEIREGKKEGDRRVIAKEARAFYSNITRQRWLQDMPCPPFVGIERMVPAVDGRLDVANGQDVSHPALHHFVVDPLVPRADFPTEGAVRATLSAMGIRK